MITAPRAATRRVVLAGNPNTGKTTLFNQLTGSRGRVGNYPGVTVERHYGKISLPDLTEAELLDSPGAYSLSARSADEQIALGAIAGLPPSTRPDLVVVVLDSTQLSRNLYLAVQIIELGIPVILCLNLTDRVESEGFAIDAAKMQEEFRVPVVRITARTGFGLDELRRNIAAVLHDPSRGRAQPGWLPLDGRLATAITETAALIPPTWTDSGLDRSRALALWALLSIDDADELTDIPADLRVEVARQRAAAEAEGRNLDQEIVELRYRFVDAATSKFLVDLRRRQAMTERLDRVLLHPILGLAIFTVAMVLIFQSIFIGADPLIAAIEGAFGSLGAGLRDALPPGMMVDFLVDGLLAGVGAFVVFLPQIVILFLFIGALEDSGYMARVAVLMDRIMKAVGLHGRAFVPMLSANACAVPAIMATRTMERRRDRMITMMAVPLMTCSARLPVYGLLIAALYPPGDEHWFGQGMMMAGMYLFGTVTALVVAWVLGKTLFDGRSLPLIIELPTYRMPHWPSVCRMVWEQSREFLTKAGTIILLCSIGLWILLTFPAPDPALTAAVDAQIEVVEARAESDPEAAQRLSELNGERAAIALNHSYAGRMGRAIEPAVRPLGYDWKIAVGIIGAFAAREVFVSTMGVVYGVGADVDEEAPSLRARLRAATWPDGRPVFTALTCLSLMIFFALACQCFSTLAVVARETQSWRWPAFMLVYQTGLAWLLSFAAFQVGQAMGF